MQTVYTFFFFSLACALMLLFTGYSGGPAATLGVGYTGAPGDDMTFTCATCHNANAFGEVMVELTSDGSEVTYSAATSTPVKLTVTATSGMPSGYGIQLIALNEENTMVLAILMFLHLILISTRQWGIQSYFMQQLLLSIVL